MRPNELTDMTELIVAFRMSLREHAQYTNIDGVETVSRRMYQHPENTNQGWVLNNDATSKSEARGGAVGWGTALQAGRLRVRFPMVSLNFFIDTILPAALWPWGWINL
jgi:hypothetical protein